MTHWIARLATCRRRCTLMVAPAVTALACSTSAAPAPNAGRVLTARVVGVFDGDTIKVLTGDRQELKLRLAEIDAPESGQPYGRAAKRELSSLVFARSVVLVPTGVDRYGRTVARVRVGAVDVAAEMLRRGAAWFFVAYGHDPSLPPIEARARASRVGLWALAPAERVPPWEWRKVRREGAHAAFPAFPALRLPFARARANPNPGSSCSDKRFCAQMSSCAEAVYHLKVCGQTRLDGDGDGKPCERLCG